MGQLAFQASLLNNVFSENCGHAEVALAMPLVLNWPELALATGELAGN